ncbi:MAG: phage tail protein [Proteobacteria bacterium]|nr:phage tail protein [Pseudomonadota bacterium]
MVVVTVRIDGLKQFQRSMSHMEGQVNKKCQQALNRTLQRSRTQMTNAIGEKLNLRKKTIRELISLQQANKNTGLIGKLSVKNKPVPLIEYKARQNRKGVSVKIFHDRPRQLVRHAFICPDSRARLTVFKREPGAGRLPIKPLYGTTAMYVAKDMLGKVESFARIFFKEEINRLLALKTR